MSNILNLGKDLYIKGRIGWKGLKKEEYLDSGNYKIINATALENGYIDWSNCGYISKERYEESPEIMLQENDLLISKDGTLGKIGYVKNMKAPCSVASGIFVIRNTAKEKVNFDYLYHLLTSHIFKDFINRNKAAGSTINHLYQRDLEHFEINLPSIEKQKQVAFVLNSIDSKIKNNKNQIETLEALAKTIYDYWFVQFDFPNEEGKPYKSSGGKMVWNEELKREIPEGWNVGLFDEYCKIFTGKKDVKQSLGSGKYKFYSCAPDHKYSNDKLYEGKAILISGNGSYTGRTIFVEEAFDLYQRTYACVDKTENSIIEYLYLTILKFFVPIIQGGTHGSAIPYIVYNDIAKIRFAMNKDVIEKFQNKAVKILKKINNKKKENLELNSLRLFLLPFLMNGQVKV